MNDQGVRDMKALIAALRKELRAMRKNAKGEAVKTPAAGGTKLFNDEIVSIFQTHFDEINLIWNELVLLDESKTMRDAVEEWLRRGLVQLELEDEGKCDQPC